MLTEHISRSPNTSERFQHFPVLITYLSACLLQLVVAIVNSARNFLLSMLHFIPLFDSTQTQAPTKLLNVEIEILQLCGFPSITFVSDNI